MAHGINKVILIGNLGQDPELRYTTGGSAVCNVSLATSDSWKNKQTGDKEERTEWHKLVFFNKLAELVSQYTQKGSSIYAEGSIRNRKYTDKNDIDRYVTEIIVSTAHFLSIKADRQTVEVSGNKKDSYTDKRYKQTNDGYNDATPDLPGLEEDNDFPDDDIPF